MPTDDSQQVQLLFKTSNGGNGETVFANYLPITMVKEIITANGFFTKDEWQRIIEEEGPDVGVDDRGL